MLVEANETSQTMIHDKTNVHETTVNTDIIPVCVFG